MSQFLAASFSELRHNKCKKIIEELENLEKSFFNKVKSKENHGNSELAGFFRGKTISPHFIKPLKKCDFLKFPTNIEEIIPKYFKESEKFIDNQEVSPKGKSENLVALRCFDRLKYILSEIAHIIHYNSIPFELNNFLNPEKEISYFSLFRPKFEKEKFFNNMMPSVEFARNFLAVESRNNGIS